MKTFRNILICASLALAGAGPVAASIVVAAAPATSAAASHSQPDTLYRG